jgi:hypothetical protein
LLAHLRDSSRGVGMRKIDNSLAFWKRGRQIVPDIDLGDNFEFRIGRRAGDESLSHTAFSAVDEQFERGHKSVRSLESVSASSLQPRLIFFHRSFNAERVERNFSLLASLISQSGSRTSALMTPLRKRAYLIGTGFGSMNKSLKRR